VPAAVPATARRWRQVPRCLIGVLLVATGVGKSLDMPGFALVVADYDLLPSSLVPVAAYTLPFFELATGACLLTRAQLRTAAWSAIGLHLLLLTAVIITLGRGLQIANCGCFGVFLARPLTVQTGIEDAAMLALSLLALRFAGATGQATQYQSWISKPDT